jgi:hypothetical protein
VINGVNTINSITQVNLYPNPASDKVMVDFASKENFSASVKMIDLSGKTIKTFGTAEIKSGINNLSLNIEGLNTGIYMLVVEAGNGRICQRFIKN